MCLNKNVSLADVFPIIEESLNGGGSAVFVARGTSMEPLFKDGKTAVRIIKPAETPKKRDIIFYRRSNGDFILHRIVDVKEKGYVCRGDNQLENEFPVLKENIIGVVTHYNNGKREKAVNRFWQKLYARIWVNCSFLKKIKHKFFDKKVR